MRRQQVIKKSLGVILLSQIFLFLECLTEYDEFLKVFFHFVNSSGRLMRAVFKGFFQYRIKLRQAKLI